RESLEVLSNLDKVHQWLARAFEFRIRQALEGKANRGGLPAKLLEELESFDREPRLKLDRMREHSRILEPHEKIDPWTRWHGHFTDELSRELALLFEITDTSQLLNQLTEFLQTRRKWSGVKYPQVQILAVALELAHRLGEAFARDVLGRVV